MRFVWAVAAFVLAALLIGAGIAQRTVFQGPTSETAAVDVADDTAFVVIDGDVLADFPDSQTLRAQGDGTIFAAYGRTEDVQSWLADSAYAQVVRESDGTLSTELVEPESETTDDAADAEAEQSAEGDAVAGRNPAGSDLWLDEFQDDDVLIATLPVPSGMSLLIATDGTAPAPSQISISWPIRNSTPWAGPLIVLGGILMAVGVFLYILAIRHARRSRGPRRKGLPVAVTEPIDVSIESEEKGVISSAPPTRRSLSGGKRALIAVPAVLVSMGLLAGCDSNAWPDLAASSTPSPTATVVSTENQQSPAVTKAQAERILTRIAETVAQADEAKDYDLAATRLDGAALAARQTDYKLRASIADRAPLPAIPSAPLAIVLPQAYDEWPRSVMAIADDADAKTSSVMVLTQQDQWAPYKLAYEGDLEASTAMPDLAPAYIGASQIPPDSDFLVMAPEDIAAAYADVIAKGDDSEYASMFEADGDQFRSQITADRQKRLDEFNQTATNTAKLEFASTAGTSAPLALATLESGAIVAVTINESDTVTPTNSDAVIKLDNNPAAKALTGVDQSASGITTTYSDQLFFYVPAQGSNEKIRLLGYSTNILDAKVN